MPRYAQSLWEQLYEKDLPCGACSWRHILEGCLGAGVEMVRRQGGYLHMYPFLLPLRDAGATGLAGVLCPRGSTPLLQQGEPDTHRQHQESHRGGTGREGNGGRKEKREQSYPAACKCVLLFVHTGMQVCSPKMHCRLGTKEHPGLG